MTALPDNFQLSIYQQGLIEFVNNPNEQHAICNAVAGSGKSTTLYLVALKLISQGISPDDIKVIVFGKQNSIDLIDKFGEHWRNSICTLHSLGYYFCTQTIGKIKDVDRDKYKKIAKELDYIGTAKKPGLLLKSKTVEDERQFLKLFDLARFNLDAFEPKALERLALHHNFDKILNYVACADAMYTLADIGLEWSEERGIVDYADMIHIPVCIYQYWRQKWFKPYKYALIDECQDLNQSQLQMSLHLAEKLVYVGDPQQSIYGFAGAGIDSYYQIKLSTQATELPLSVCYRCPTSHIELVNRLFSNIPIRQATAAKEGILQQIDKDKATHEQGDLILSRKTAPLIAYCLKLIAKGIAAKVKGRDIGNELLNEINQIWDYAQQTTDILNFEHFLPYCNNYESFKQKKWYTLDNFDRLCEMLSDKLDTIATIYKDANPIVNTLKELKDKVQNLFSDKEQTITLCTIHRAKGLESDRVFILNPNDMPLSWRYQKRWEYQQELNILYVALTRSKSELYLMDEEISWLKEARE
jgi:DNA helicase II / ATP-dependent DNA helicase PcrA